MDADLIPGIIGTLIPFGVFVMVVLIVWFGTREKQARVQARTDLHKHLLDKFGSGAELAQFLETEGGKKMIEDLGRPSPAAQFLTDPASSRARALKHIQAGFILLFLGIGFLVVTYRGIRLGDPGCSVHRVGDRLSWSQPLCLCGCRRAGKRKTKVSQPDGPNGCGVPEAWAAPASG